MNAVASVPLTGEWVWEEMVGSWVQKSPAAAERAPKKRPSESNIKPDAPSKKQRTERVTTKDFVPPDVSGLSKREARLVKNRAAAFLSRQRKREEFECMEVYAAASFFANIPVLTPRSSAGASPSSSRRTRACRRSPRALRRQQWTRCTPR